MRPDALDDRCPNRRVGGKEPTETRTVAAVTALLVRGRRHATATGKHGTAVYDLRDGCIRSNSRPR